MFSVSWMIWTALVSGVSRQVTSASFLQRIYSSLRGVETQKRVVFAEGEEQAVIRAAYGFQQENLGRAILIGREEYIRKGLKDAVN